MEWYGRYGMVWYVGRILRLELWPRCRAGSADMSRGDRLLWDLIIITKQANKKTNKQRINQPNEKTNNQMLICQGGRWQKKPDLILPTSAAVLISTSAGIHVSPFQDTRLTWWLICGSLEFQIVCEPCFIVILHWKFPGWFKQCTQPI